MNGGYGSYIVHDDIVRQLKIFFSSISVSIRIGQSKCSISVLDVLW